MKAIAALGGCLVSAVLLVMSSTDCSHEVACTSIGCDNGAEIRADLPAEKTFNAATFSLCLNGQCSTGSYGSVDGGLDGPESNPIELTGALFEQSVDLIPDKSGDGMTVEFEFSPFAREPDAGYTTIPLHDGDVYAVKIVDEDGGTNLDATRTVSYVNPYAGNSQCALNCQTATIDVTP